MVEMCQPQTYDLDFKSPDDKWREIIKENIGRATKLNSNTTGHALSVIYLGIMYDNYDAQLNSQINYREKKSETSLKLPENTSDISLNFNICCVYVDSVLAPMCYAIDKKKIITPAFGGTYKVIDKFLLDAPRDITSLIFSKLFNLGVRPSGKLLRGKNPDNKIYSNLMISREQLLNQIKKIIICISEKYYYVNYEHEKKINFSEVDKNIDSQKKDKLQNPQNKNIKILRVDLPSTILVTENNLIVSPRTLFCDKKNKNNSEKISGANNE